MEEYIGRCHCGKNTFRVNNQSEFQFICYCDSCKQINSGGHLCGIVFDESHLTKAQHTKTYHYAGGSGSDIILHFCLDCGTHLYAYPTEFANKVVVRANTLKEFNFEPQQNLYAESAYHWDHIVAS